MPSSPAIQYTRKKLYSCSTSTNSTRDPNSVCNHREKSKVRFRPAMWHRLLPHLPRPAITLCSPTGTAKVGHCRRALRNKPIKWQQSQDLSKSTDVNKTTRRKDKQTDFDGNCLPFSVLPCTVVPCRPHLFSVPANRINSEGFAVLLGHASSDERDERSVWH